jgi:hypothetical protein
MKDGLLGSDGTRDFRRRIVVNLRDPVVKAFWITEFEQWQDKFRAEAIAPIQNKVGQFLSTSIIRNIVGQSSSTILPREAMDTRKILIVNLAKGRLGEEASRLLGGMLITKMQLGAMERVDIPREEDRQDFYLYIDEFQNFATESFANILSEARKYRLSLVMAHQYIEQLDETVAAAVFGNVGTLASFRVGAADAEKLAVEFAPTFTEEDLVNLPKHNIYLKLMIDGIASDPFSAVTLPPVVARTESALRVIATSREKYSRPQAVVEKEILAWSETRQDIPAGGEATLAAYPSPKGGAQKKLHEYTCARCRENIFIPVELDRNRPIYCEKCMEIVRAERREKKEREGSVAEKRTPDAKPALADPAAVVQPTGKEVSLRALEAVQGAGDRGGEKTRKRRRKRKTGSVGSSTPAVSPVPSKKQAGEAGLFPW